MDTIIFGSISDGILNSEVNEKRNRKKKKKDRERKNKGGEIKRSGKFFPINNQKKKKRGVPFLGNFWHPLQCNQFFPEHFSTTMMFHQDMLSCSSD